MSGRVTGAMNNVERQIADSHGVSVNQPAVGLKTMRFHAIARAVIVQLLNPKTVVLMRAFDFQAQFLGEHSGLPAMVEMAMRDQ